MNNNYLMALLFFFSIFMSFTAVSGADSASIGVDKTTSTYLTDYTASPVKIGSDPSNGELNVETNKQIRINFSKPIRFKTGWIELKSHAGLTSINKTIEGNTLTLTPRSELDKSTVYTIIVHSNSLTDLDGNSVACIKTRFSTLVRIDVVNRETGGDIRKNVLLTSYLPDTMLTDQIIEKAKTGTPMITFGDGNGPKVFLVAGVHGNELPASAAAMKLINYLNGKEIRGTVYIVPFAIPICTSHTMRYYYGKNPNKIANISGSPTNILINLAKTLKVQARGDFHSTQPGGIPGKDSALCTWIPTFKSYQIAWYISKISVSAFIADEIAGKEYPGAVEDVSNLIGLPAVTCEVLIPHGTLNWNRITKSCNQMLAFLHYNKIYPGFLFKVILQV